MKTNRWALVLLFCMGMTTQVFSADANQPPEDAKAKAVKEKQLELKDLMPEKSLFGPSAQNMGFSSDGQSAAYLYRSYKERRHGNDLFVYNVKKGQIKRVTWPSVMAQFQKKTRDVVEDRIKKAKKAPAKVDSSKAKGDKDQKVDTKKKKEAVQEPLPAKKDDGQKKKATRQKKNKERRQKERDAKQAKKLKKERDNTQKKASKGAQKEEDEETLKKRGDWVSDKDADDKKAPRYSGISSPVWSPVANELLFTSEGDVYLYALDEDKVTRLTHTRAREYSVTWLLDGSGFTFNSEAGLFTMRLSDRTLRQLDPRFPKGDSMRAYSLSPDGRTMAFLTDKEVGKSESSKVEIANYRDRMMKAREVNRHVSDDKLAVHEKRIYLYTLSELADEKDTLTEVYLGKTHMPDDMVKAPVWSPDSKKIAFFSFDQDAGVVQVFEANVPEKKEEESKADPNKPSQKAEDKAVAKDESKKEEAGKAKEIYRFLHHGGPNTPRMMVFHYLADSRRLVYLSEQSGFRHLHMLDPLYENSKPLTSGPYEVYPLNISRDREWLFFEATKEHPSQLDIYRLNLESGQMTRLTQDVGQHTQSAISQDGTRVLTNLASYDQLKELVFIDVQKGTQKILTDSHPEKAHTFAEPSPEFFDFKNRHGHQLYGMMFKSDDWKETDKRPVLIYFYGGPLGTRKMVVQGSFSPYNFAFPYYMAKKHGYVACTIDTRGNSGYAGVFEKANFGQVGKPQVEDLVDAVGYLVENQGVDKSRIGLHGWSFGGFQTQMCLYTEPNVFQVGIAGAGPTEWENYNSWYTRHTIGKSEPGKATLKKFSLLPLAKNLKGHLLLVHGMEDSNVLYQDTVRVYRELLKAGKETLVELFLDPTGGHGLGGDVKTLSRYKKYESFLLRTLGAYSVKKEAVEK